MKNMLINTLTRCLFKLVDPRTVLYTTVHKLAQEGVKVEIKVRGGML